MLSVIAFGSIVDSTRTISFSRSPNEHQRQMICLSDNNASQYELVHVASSCIVSIGTHMDAPSAIDPARGQSDPIEDSRLLSALIFPSISPSRRAPQDVVLDRPLRAHKSQSNSTQTVNHAISICGPPGCRSEGPAEGGGDGDIFSFAGSHRHRRSTSVGLWRHEC